MKALTVGQLMMQLSRGLHTGSIKIDTPILVGKDEELNEIRQAYFAQSITQEEMTDLPLDYSVSPEQDAFFLIS